MDNMNDLCALLDMDDIEEKSAKTKRGLIPSIIAVILCLAMLAGTTLAWFTDTTSSGLNQIRSGSLDVDVQYTLNGTDWATLQDATNLFGGSDALFEPGYTRVVAFKITNNGGVAIKYKVGMNIVGETKGINKAGEEFLLSDYLKVKTAPTDDAANVSSAFASREDGETLKWTEKNFKEAVIAEETNINAGTDKVNYYVMKVYMPETVDNVANAKSMKATPSIKFGVDVVATQAPVEADSYGTDYDKNATYPEVAELIPAGKSFTSGTHTLSTGVTATDKGAVAVKASGKDTKVTITGGHYDGGEGGDNQCIQVRDGATVTIKDGTFTVGGDAKGSGNSVVYSVGGHVIIEGGFFYTDYSWNNFYYVLNMKNGSNGSITVKGGTFVNYNPARGDDTGNPNNFVASGYKVETETQANGDVWYTVVPESTP